MAAALAVTILNWKEDKAILWKFRRDKVPFAMGGRMYQILKLVTIFTFASLDFGSAAYRAIVGHEDTGVSVLAHIFGFLTGLLAGFIVCMDRIEEKWERVLKQVCWTLSVYLLSIIMPCDDLFISFHHLTGLLDDLLLSSWICHCCQCPQFKISCGHFWRILQK